PPPVLNSVPYTTLFRSRAEKQLMYGDRKTLDENGNPLSGAQINLTNIMPRIGLIYDFTQRGLSKVYASYGRFYEYIPLDLADRSDRKCIRLNSSHVAIS